MNDNARKWVEALRSGEYTQAQGRLRRGDRFCCLGVACEEYHKDTGQGEWRADLFVDGGDKATAWLPKSVAAWLGLANRTGRFEGDSLIRRNDIGETFDAVADTIESEPEGLFA